MKELIPLPLTIISLFRTAALASCAQDIQPWLDQDHPIQLSADSDNPDEQIGGETDVILFEKESDIDAFEAGFDAAGPGDDTSFQKYSLPQPIDGFEHVLILHNSDGDDRLSIRKYAEGDSS